LAYSPKKGFTFDFGQRSGSKDCYKTVFWESFCISALSLRASRMCHYAERPQMAQMAQNETPPGKTEGRFILRGK